MLAGQAQAALPPLPPVKYDHYEDPEEEYYAAMDDIWEQQSLEKVNALCDTIARCRKQGGLMYQAEKLLKDFNEFDIETLNEKLGFDMKYHKGKPIFNYYLATAKLDHYPFWSPCSKKPGYSWKSMLVTISAQQYFRKSI